MATLTVTAQHSIHSSSFYLIQDFYRSDVFGFLECFNKELEMK